MNPFCRPYSPSCTDIHDSLLSVKSSIKRRRFFCQPVFGSGSAGLGNNDMEDKLALLWGVTGAGALRMAQGSAGRRERAASIRRRCFERERDRHGLGRRPRLVGGQPLHPLPSLTQPGRERHPPSHRRRYLPLPADSTKRMSMRIATTNPGPLWLRPGMTRRFDTRFHRPATPSPGHAGRGRP